MKMESTKTPLLRIKKAIEKHAFVRANEMAIVNRKSGAQHETGWLFDLRNILLKGDVLDDIATLFWKAFKTRAPIQIGGIETAAIALVAGLVSAGYREHDQVDISGFFIRKSRKKDGLMKMLEGEVVKERPIVLVDDLMNSGSSFIRQVTVLESLGHKISAVFVLVRFRDLDFYKFFKERNIAIHSLFTLEDFAETLGTHNLVTKEKPVRTDPFKIIWKFASNKPSYQYVVPKSDPALDGRRVYFGSDQGTMWALDQSDGNVAWSHQIGIHKKGKGIFSSPAVYNDTVYFGGYDGNFYALEAETGKKRWISFEADWIGSSPAISTDLGLIFVGLEFGLWRKRGGIAAFDMNSGRTVWVYREMPCLTHSSPLYIPEYRQTIVGSNDGAAYLFDARSGTLKWRFETGVLAEQELNTGFSAYDIKESFAYDAKRDIIIFGNKKDSIFFVDRKTGKQISTYKVEFGFFSTPVIYDDTVLVPSLDKHLYCIDLETYQEKWRWYGGARIFATPVVIENSIFIGANTGRLTEIDPETGKEKSFFTVTERITNRVAYNPKTKRFFLPTFANEIYCIEKKDSSFNV